MGNREFGVVALGRFLAVERYRETHVSSVTGSLWGPADDRAGSHDGTAGSRSSGDEIPASGYARRPTLLRS
jgi:hypothetical protein